jgi:hypothetical protein
MPEWQETYLTDLGRQSYETSDKRVHLHIDARIDPIFGETGSIRQSTGGAGPALLLPAQQRQECALRYDLFRR